MHRFYPIFPESVTMYAGNAVACNDLKINKVFEFL